MKLDPEARLIEYERVVEHANGTKDPLDHSTIQKINQLIEDSQTTDDPIFQVNCLQLIADLACSAEALKILEERQTPQKLITLLQESDPLIVPHALKFFYRVNPSHLETKYLPVLEKIFDYCDSEDAQLLDHAIDFIAAIGRGGYQARRILHNHSQFKHKCLERLGSTLVCSSDLIKSRALKCIHDLLEAHEDESYNSDSKDQSEKLSESFYFTILPGEHKMRDRLLSLCRYPFMEIRVNALLVVAAVAGYEWGQKELASHPTFVKWILDRSTEKCKEGKEAKFEILRTLVKSRTTTRYFKGEDYMKMRADAKKGPFHVGVAEEMMMDEKTG